MVVGLALFAGVFAAVVHIAAVAAVFAGTLEAHSDALSEHGFASADPDLWRRMAARHRVGLLVEPVRGGAFAFDPDGREVAPETSRAFGTVRTVREAPDGSRVTLDWGWDAARALQLPIIGVLVLLVTGIVAAASGILRRRLRPLTDLQVGVEALARGDLDVRVPVVRNDEIGRVATAFNAMAARIREAAHARERLLADVGHELRSPLARMRVAVELLPESRERAALERDVRETARVVEALLEREALNARALPDQLPVVRLDVLVREAAAPESEHPDVVFRTEQTSIRADPDLLRILVRNLVENARRASRVDSGPIEVVVEHLDRAAVLRVEDDGTGIPSGWEERVLEPFVKVDPARGHHGGLGLGLDLCRRIAEHHDGTLRLERRSPRGTVAILEIPTVGADPTHEARPQAVADSGATISGR